jgi:hypothetical protein
MGVRPVAERQEHGRQHEQPPHGRRHEILIGRFCVGRILSADGHD